MGRVANQKRKEWFEEFNRREAQRAVESGPRVRVPSITKISDEEVPDPRNVLREKLESVAVQCCIEKAGLPTYFIRCADCPLPSG